MVPKVGLQELWSCEMLFRMKGSTDPSLIQQIFVKSLLNAWCWASLVAQWQRIRLPKQETWVQSLGWEDHLKKDMETHSSILAWRIPWTEEPGRL